MKNNLDPGVKQRLKFIFNCTFDNFELQSTFCIMDPRVNIVSIFNTNQEIQVIYNNLKIIKLTILDPKSSDLIINRVLQLEPVSVVKVWDDL